MAGTNPLRNRAGADKLTWLLLALALIFCWSKYTLCLTVVLVLYALYRMFSRDISARRREEASFNTLRADYFARREIS